MARMSDNPSPSLLLVEQEAAPAAAASGDYPGIQAGQQRVYAAAGAGHLAIVDSTGASQLLALLEDVPQTGLNVTVYNATDNSSTVTLPDATGAEGSQNRVYIKADATANTINLQGATVAEVQQLIDGNPTYVLSTQYQAVILTNAGLIAGWTILAEFPSGSGPSTLPIGPPDATVPGTIYIDATSGAINYQDASNARVVLSAPYPIYAVVGDDFIVDASATAILRKTITGDTTFTSANGGATNGILHLWLVNSAETDAVLTFGNFFAVEPALTVPAGHDFLITFATQAGSSWLYYLRSYDMGS